VTSRRRRDAARHLLPQVADPYLDADNLFDLTKRGFAFFEEEFDCAYPFEKYDQIFTPEYNMGAMENAGA
jgi:aminopeptidase N